jgi:hypothetical protein
MDGRDGVGVPIDRERPDRRLDVVERVGQIPCGEGVGTQRRRTLQRDHQLLVRRPVGDQRRGVVVHRPDRDA